MTPGFAGEASALVSQALDEDSNTASEESGDSQDLEFNDLVVPKKRVSSKYHKLEWTPWSYGDKDYFYDEAK